MAFTPISNTVPQYEENGVAASGYFIKFYDSGTTTPTAMATDSTGTTLLDKCELNTEGYPINGSSAVFIPHINKKYKIALFRNAADADANDLASAAWPAVDNILPVISEGYGEVDTIANLRLLKPSFDGQQVELLGHTLAGIGGGGFYYDASDTTSADNSGTVIVTDGGHRWKRIFENTVHVSWFGAVGDGVANDTLPVKNACVAGETIIFNGGCNYLIEEVNQVIVASGKTLIGNGATISCNSSISLVDEVGSFSRYNNGLFYGEVGQLTGDVTISGFNFDVKAEKVTAIHSGLKLGAERESATGKYIIRDNNFQCLENNSAGDTGNAPAVTIHASNVLIEGNTVNDFGYGLYCINGKNLTIKDNFLNFCGVSRDYGYWSNVSGITAQSYLHSNVINNTITVTGGSSIFVSVVSEDVKTSNVSGNTLIGCGLSAIESGVRSFVGAVKEIESVEVCNNTILGSMCAPLADQHGAIHVGADQENILSHVKHTRISNNDVEYLAPWESWNDVTLLIEGSFNTNKNDKGSTVGNCAGIRVVGANTSGNSFGEVVCIDNSITHFQKIGIQYGRIDSCTSRNNTVKNCGWERTVSDEALQLQGALLAYEVDSLTIDDKVVSACVGCVENSSWCYPLILIDVAYVNISLEISGSSLQARPIRSNAGVGKMIVDRLTSNQSGVTGVFPWYPISSTNTDTTPDSLEWNAKKAIQVNPGTTFLSAGVREIYKRLGSSTSTWTWAPARFYKEDSVVINLQQSGTTITINPRTGETIDGGSSLVLNGPARVTMYSDGAAWVSSTN